MPRNQENEPYEPYTGPAFEVTLPPIRAEPPLILLMRGTRSPRSEDEIREAGSADACAFALRNMPGQCREHEHNGV